MYTCRHVYETTRARAYTACHSFPPSYDIVNCTDCQYLFYRIVYIHMRALKFQFLPFLVHFFPLSCFSIGVTNILYHFKDGIIDAICYIVWGGAGKSLARPGRKQVTVTELGIYSTYSPRSSIHFLVRCCNFCKPLKKIRRLSVQPGLRGNNDLRVGRKMAKFQFFFSVQGTGGSPTGPDLVNRVVIKTLEAQVGQFLLYCKCPVSRGIVVQEQDLLGELPAAFFLQNVLKLHQ